MNLDLLLHKNHQAKHPPLSPNPTAPTGIQSFSQNNVSSMKATRSVYLPTCLSIYPFILSTHPSLYPSIHPSICISICPSICLSTCLPTYLSVLWFRNDSIQVSINALFFPSSMSLSICISWFYFSPWFYSQLCFLSIKTKPKWLQTYICLGIHDLPVEERLSFPEILGNLE